MNKKKIKIVPFAFEKMVGKKFDFYGVDNNRFKLGADVLEVIDDASDGYRSYLATVEVSGKGGIYFRLPIAKVIIKEITEENSVDRNDDGYELIDCEDGHIWLSFGTNRADSCYPQFYFNYYPKAEVKETKSGRNIT